jgi:hypothetical protein
MSKQQKSKRLNFFSTTYKFMDDMPLSFPSSKKAKD